MSALKDIAVAFAAELDRRDEAQRDGWSRETTALRGDLAEVRRDLAEVQRTQGRLLEAMQNLQGQVATLTRLLGQRFGLPGE